MSFTAATAPVPPAPPSTGRGGWIAWAVLGSAVAAALVLFAPALRFMWATWQQVPEYGHGAFLPVLALYFAWQQRAALSPATPGWRTTGPGLALVVFGLAQGAVGEWAAVRVLSQAGFVAVLAGLVGCAFGTAAWRTLWLPLALLALMVPLPQFVLAELSQRLQLWSSELGVALMRAADISVHLAGNVIDLGRTQLQVADACSGLRYLFPLIALGLVAAALFRAPWPLRVTLVLSTLPLAVLVNGLRVGLVGIGVEHLGPRAISEGLMHEIEGWLVFMACLALLAGEMALLLRLLPGPRRRLRDSLALSPAVAAAPAAGPAAPAAVGLALVLAAGLVVASLLAWLLVPTRAPLLPQPAPLAQLVRDWPGGWLARSEPLDAEVKATLATSDHLLASWQRGSEPAVAVFVAWYASQGGGQSSHSPRTCLPGGGWRIAEQRVAELSLPGRTAPLPVNRVLIEQGPQRQLVVYWFEQRGRPMTGELAVKASILRDGLVHRRTDGGLVRLVTPVAEREDVSAAERRLLDWLAVGEPLLRRHLPPPPTPEGAPLP
jgi:exosortase D (VPLPA-CTERM-specific)